VIPSVAASHYLEDDFEIAAVAAVVVAEEDSEISLLVEPSETA
jgi:hypothetical protein